jgi:hypothetical protein
METILIVVVVMLAMLVLAGIVVGIFWVYLDARKMVRELASDIVGLQASIVLLKDSLGDHGKVPGYLEGLTKVCGDQVIKITEMNALIERFRLSLFGPEKTPKDAAHDGFQAYDDRLADQSYEIQQMVEAGYSPEEARDKISTIRRSGTFNLG